MDFHSTLVDSSPETLRRASIVTTNIVKLVRDPAVAAKYLGPLSDAVSKVASGASFPEVRAFAQEAEVVLKAAGGGPTLNGDAEQPKENGVEPKDGVEEDVLLTIVKSMPPAWVVKPKFELPGTQLSLVLFLIGTELMRNSGFDRAICSVACFAEDLLGFCVNDGGGACACWEGTGV